MSVQGLNSQRPAVQTFQSTQPSPLAQRKEGPAQAQDPLAALTKALEALEKAVASLSGNKSFSNGQSVAQQAGQNLGQSGASQAQPFDLSTLFGGGSAFEPQRTTTVAQPAPAPQRQDNAFLNGSGGGGGPVSTHADHGLHLGNEKSGGGGTGVRIGSDGANN